MIEVLRKMETRKIKQLKMKVMDEKGTEGWISFNELIMAFQEAALETLKSPKK